MEFINEILSASVKGGSLNAWLIFAAGLLLYFVAEYKTRSTADPFSFAVWLKDNTVNVIISIAFALIYNMSAEQVNASALIAIAAGGNWLIDLYLTWKYYRIHGK